MTYLIPAALIYQGLHSGIIGTISSITMKTCSLLTNDTDKEIDGIVQKIKGLDIENKLKLIMIVINHLNKSDKQKHHNDTRIINDYMGRTYDPIEYCIYQMEQTMVKINDNLRSIELAIHNHRQKWFSKWRHSSIEDRYNKLESSVNVLNERFEMLIKVSQIIIGKSVMP